MKGGFRHGSSRSGAQRAVALLSLGLLFLIGPLHVWHHADEASVGPDSKCLPCSTFHKSFWIPTAETGLAANEPFAGIAVAPTQRIALQTDFDAAATRAPPTTTN